MATACDICGKLYNAGRKLLGAFDICPECADKVYKYIRTMNSEVEIPEYIPSGHSN